MANIKNCDTTNAGKDAEKLDHTYIGDGNVKWITIWQFLKKHATIIQPSNCPPGHSSQRNEDLGYIKTSIQMFIAALLVTVPNWKQSQYLSTDEWLSTPRHIRTLEYYSGIKRNELLTQQSGESPENSTQCKQPIPKGYILHDTIYIAF